jgi:hypothetical protein
MKDLIDERNEREKISRSIVKFWNVNYVPAPPEPEETDDAALADTDANGAAEEEERNAESSYNATTGSYSGDYGKGELTDEVTKGQIEKILHEKTDAIQELFDHRDEL